MRDVVAAAIDNLSNLQTNIDELEKVEDQLAEAKDKLSAVSKQHKEISDALETKRGLLDKAREDAVRNHDTQMFEKTKQLRQLMAQIESLRAERDELKVDVAALQNHHDGILASLESLRKTINA